MENLENILESILFVSGDAVDIVDITSKLDVTKAEINKAVKKLKARYGENSGITLLEFNNKLQLSSNSHYANEVSLVLNPIRQRNLSKSMLETASIIAYKQPVTRLEVEEIRGANSDYSINILLEHGLIEIVGRKDTVGKPVLFGTTDEFLKRFNLTSISDLPDYNSLLERIKVVETKDDRLYNHFEVPVNEEEAKVAAGVHIDEDVLNGEVIGEAEEFDETLGQAENTLESEEIESEEEESPSDLDDLEDLDDDFIGDDDFV